MRRAAGQELRTQIARRADSPRDRRRRTDRLHRPRRRNPAAGRVPPGPAARPRRHGGPAPPRAPPERLDRPHVPPRRGLQVLRNPRPLQYAAARLPRRLVRGVPGLRRRRGLPFPLRHEGPRRGARRGVRPPPAGRLDGGPATARQFPDRLRGGLRGGRNPLLGHGRPAGRTPGAVRHETGLQNPRQRILPHGLSLPLPDGRRRQRHAGRLSQNAAPHRGDGRPERTHPRRGRLHRRHDGRTGLPVALFRPRG